MIRDRARVAFFLVACWSVLAAVACSGGPATESASVNFSYVIEKEKGLPAGMKTIAIVPAKIGETTDPKWSDMSSTILASLINESRGKFVTPITVTERRDTKPVFDEADLAAAGMTTKTGGKQ